jgi:flavin prenyltransferase
MRIIVAMTGATGAIFGVRLLQRLRDIDTVDTHLIMSKWARLNINAETPYTPAQVEALADVVYAEGDQSAAISSGSFRVDAMVVAPCSMRTLAAIRHGLADNLITRAADVILKERRTLCLMPRETPLSAIHLENMLELARLGAGICPPMPAFYNHPDTVEDVVDHIAVRLLDQLGLDIDYPQRWAGLTGQHHQHPGERRAAPAARHGYLETLMWEAAAEDGVIDSLRHWVKDALHQHLRRMDPGVDISTYFNADGRVVVIATGDVSGFQPPPVPPGMTRRDTHLWRFTRDDHALTAASPARNGTSALT